jgi:hypothetical protein
MQNPHRIGPAEHEPPTLHIPSPDPYAPNTPHHLGSRKCVLTKDDHDLRQYIIARDGGSLRRGRGCGGAGWGSWTDPAGTIRVSSMVLRLVPCLKIPCEREMPHMMYPDRIDPSLHQDRSGRARTPHPPPPHPRSLRTSRSSPLQESQMYHIKAW